MWSRRDLGCLTSCVSIITLGYPQTAISDDFFSPNSAKGCVESIKAVACGENCMLTWNAECQTLQRASSSLIFNKHV